MALQFPGVRKIVEDFEMSKRSDWIASSHCDFGERNDWIASQCNSGGSGVGIGGISDEIELIIAVNIDQHFFWGGGLTSVGKFGLALPN